jgi:hypothetical protein
LVETEGWKGIVPALRPNLGQVYNHPADLLHDNSTIGGRSGKVARLSEMIEEVIEASDRALIFTRSTKWIFSSAAILNNRSAVRYYSGADRFPKPSATAWWIAFSRLAAITLVSSSSLSRPVGQG